MSSLRRIKRRMIRSHSKGIYVADRDYRIVAGTDAVAKIQREIEGRTGPDASGFEGQYPKVVGNYFGGMVRHFQALSRYLPKGSKLAYVVGDTASYHGVPIATATVLADILRVRAMGFEVDDVVEWRARRSTGDRVAIWERVLLLTAIGRTS